MEVEVYFLYYAHIHLNRKWGKSGDGTLLLCALLLENIINDCWKLLF